MEVSDFKRIYGIQPKAIAAIWTDLHTNPYQADRIDESIEPAHLLVTFRWLKSYESETELRTCFGYLDKSIREWCKTITGKIALLKRLKVSLYCLSFLLFLNLFTD